jgi:hypothetical protein
MTASLGVKLEENGWERRLSEKKVKTGNTLIYEKWDCETGEGDAFMLSVSREKRRDTQIMIETGDGSGNNQSEITMQIYNWLTCL